MSPRPPTTARDRHRVLYVVNDLDMGGAQRVLLNQASALDQARFNPRVASLEIIPDGKLVPEFDRTGIKVHALKEPNESWMASWKRLERLIHTFKPVLVHTHLAAAGVIGRMAARGNGVAHVVSTFHNLTDWREQRMSPVRWLDRRTLVKADRLIAVSEAVRDAIVGTVPKVAQRTVIVHNGVSFAGQGLTPEQRVALRASLGYQPDHFVIGAAARLDPRKGLDTLIEAFSLARLNYPKLHLMILGEGPQRAQLESLIDRFEIHDQVQMLPHQSPIQPYMAAMDMFAAPSRTEGLGVAVIEALALGVPVIASRVGGIPEVVEDGKCGRLLPPDEIDLWAENISDLVAMPDVLARWSSVGPRYAARFSVEASTERLTRLYDELLAGDAGGHEAMAA